MTTEQHSNCSHETSIDLRTSVDRSNDHARLVERAQAKDPEAIKELITMFRPLVERVARRRCSRACEVDDVVQDVWVAFLSSLDSIHTPACLPGWLRRVAVNVTIEHGKKNRALPLAELPEPRGIRDQDDVAYRRLEAETTRRSVNQALGRLKESERDLVELLMADDRPDYSAVSKIVDRPIGSIGPTRARALRRLSFDPAILQLTHGERAPATAS
jgi:RNA polymerase sigma factor (sigma-70 family)